VLFAVTGRTGYKRAYKVLSRLKKGLSQRAVIIENAIWVTGRMKSGRLAAVLSQKLNPDILVMQPTEN
jgi:hypothetical protein